MCSMRSTPTRPPRCAFTSSPARLPQRDRSPGRGLRGAGARRPDAPGAAGAAPPRPRRDRRRARAGAAAPAAGGPAAACAGRRSPCGRSMAFGARSRWARDCSRCPRDRAGVGLDAHGRAVVAPASAWRSAHAPTATLRTTGNSGVLVVPACRRRRAARSTRSGSSVPERRCRPTRCSTLRARRRRDRRRAGQPARRERRARHRRAARRRAGADDGAADRRDAGLTRAAGLTPQAGSVAPPWRPATAIPVARRRCPARTAGGRSARTA